MSHRHETRVATFGTAAGDPNVEPQRLTMRDKYSQAWVVTRTLVLPMHP